jgi:hypothetical protein
VNEDDEDAYWRDGIAAFECSPPAAGMLLLLWQEPTDRALAGWCPHPPWKVTRESWKPESALRWLARQLLPDYGEHPVESAARCNRMNAMSADLQPYYSPYVRD